MLSTGLDHLKRNDLKRDLKTTRRGCSVVAGLASNIKRETKFRYIAKPSLTTADEQLNFLKNCTKTEP